LWITPTKVFTKFLRSKLQRLREPQKKEVLEIGNGDKVQERVDFANHKENPATIQHHRKHQKAQCSTLMMKVGMHLRFIKKRQGEGVKRKVRNSDRAINTTV
jgi:hypothetical protein